MNQNILGIPHKVYIYPESQFVRKPSYRLSEFFGNKIIRFYCSPGFWDELLAQNRIRGDIFLEIGSRME